MACHHKVLEAVKSIVESKGFNEFTPQEVIEYLREQHTIYADSTIRTHIVSRCCVNAPQHHAVRYEYFERIGRASYRIY